MTQRTCPICGKRFDPALSSAMPFCSPRCRRIDLGRWLDEQYGLPVDPSEENEEELFRMDDEDDHE